MSKKGSKKVLRVNDNEVAKLLKEGWSYCPKRVWRESKNKSSK